MKSQSLESCCRRRALRISLPLEARIQIGDRTVRAVVRDISEVDEQDEAAIGIGLFHPEALPLNQTLQFRTVVESSLLCREAECLLYWTCDYGVHGFLSGGVLVRPAGRTEGAC
jgi:hypothetical protein